MLDRGEYRLHAPPSELADDERVADGGDRHGLVELAWPVPVSAKAPQVLNMARVAREHLFEGRWAGVVCGGGGLKGGFGGGGGGRRRGKGCGVGAGRGRVGGDVAQTMLPGRS